MKKLWGFVCSLPLGLVVACSGQAPDQELVGGATQSLAPGDEAFICVPGNWMAGDQQACEDRSGVKDLEIGQCHIKVGRRCQLVPADGGYDCKCKIRVLQANDYCDEVHWSDLGVSKC